MGKGALKGRERRAPFIPDGELIPTLVVVYNPMDCLTKTVVHWDLRPHHNDSHPAKPILDVHMSARRKTPVDIEKIEPHLCTISLRLEILQSVPFFMDLAEQDLREINQLFVEKGFASGETIYFSGDTASRLYVVADGNVKLMQHAMSGQDVMLDVLKPGEFFGSLSILGDEEYANTATAQTACCAISIGAEEFRQILQRFPAVSLKVIDIMAQRLNAAHEMIRQLSAHSVEQRIAHVLLALAQKLGQQNEVGWLIQLPLSRMDLAELVGTTTETASRVMSRFQKEGLIKTGRQWVAITDRDGLLAYKLG